MTAWRKWSIGFRLTNFLLGSSISGDLARSMGVMTTEVSAFCYPAGSSFLIWRSGVGRRHGGILFRRGYVRALRRSQCARHEAAGIYSRQLAEPRHSI